MAQNDKQLCLSHSMSQETYLKTLWPLLMDGVQLPQGCSHFEEAVYFLPLSSQKFLVLILLVSSQPWSYMGPLDLESSTWTIGLLLHKVTIRLLPKCFNTIRLLHHMILNFDTHVQNDSCSIFFIFPKFRYFGFLWGNGGTKGKN